jgi:hypothetical protein
MAKTQSFVVSRDYPVWIIPDNPVWTLPNDDTGEIRFDVAHTSFPFASIRSVRGLAILTHPGKIYTHVYFHGLDYSRDSYTCKIPGELSQAECCAHLGIPDDDTIVRNVSTWPAEASDTATIFGVRTLTDVVEQGYDLSGRVSVNGRKYRAFTSSALMRKPDGKLVNVAVLHLTDSAYR